MRFWIKKLSFAGKSYLIQCQNKYTAFLCKGAKNTEIRQRVFGNGSFVKAFQYHEETGTLAYQSTNGKANVSRYLKIAYRKQNGDFEDARTVAARGTDMMLRRDGHSIDSRYVLLNGTDRCEVYDISTGNRVLSINDSGYALLEGKMYDMETDAGGRLAVYGIRELDDLLSTAERYLTSSYGTRELTEQEMERYYIVRD